VASAPGGLGEGSFIERPHGFDDDERIPPAGRPQALAQTRDQCLVAPPAGERSHESRCVAAGKRGERHAHKVRLGGDLVEHALKNGGARQLLLAGRGHDQDGRRGFESRSAACLSRVRMLRV